MNNKLNKVFKVFFSVLLAVILSVSGVITSFADTIGTGNKAKRTIMVYMDGSSSEENTPVCSAMLKEYMNAKFDRNYIRVIVITGGSMKWHLDSKYLRDQDGNSGTLNEISSEYNQIWEVFGTTDASEGYLKLLDADGVTGDGADARKSEDELMSNPETLKKFINYARNYAPAERYGLILNDHGSGPEHGYGYDDHDTVNPDAVISVTGLKHAISESDVVQNEGKFDFIDLDCCMMSNFETMLALSDDTDYFLGSPDTAPHATVDYTKVIDYLSTDPDMETEILGRKIVDLYVDFYEEHPEQRSAGKAVCYTLVDTKALKESGFIDEMLKLAEQLRTEAADGTFYDEIRASKDDYKFIITNLQDLATLVEQLGINLYEGDWQDPSLENAYTESALKIQNILHNKEIVYSKHTQYSRKTSVFFGRDDDGSITARGENAPTSGLNIFFAYNPASGDCSKELSSYIDAMKELAAASDNEAEKDLINTYLQAVIDYVLIYNTGIAVTNLVDNGCDINEINFDKVKDYFESQAENNRWDYISKAISNSDRDVEAWLNKIIDIQKNEVLSRENVSVKTESGDNTEYYCVNVKDTPKRIIDIPVLKVTAKTDNYPFANPTLTFYGNRSDEESFEDYISNVNSSYVIPTYDGQWYAVEDSEGVKHIASKASDQSVFAKFMLNGKELGAGELLFDEAGNAKSIYIYGNTIPISLDSLEGTVMVSLCNDPYAGSEATVDMPFMLEKTNARLIKDNYSNLGIENIDIKLAITDMYCVEHEIKTDSSCGVQLFGDVDGDGDVTIDDATLIQKAAIDLVSFTDLQKQLADVNGDGRVSILDVTCVQKYLAEYTTGCGKTGEKMNQTAAHTLVKSVECYRWDYRYDDWQLAQTTSIEYENAYPVMIENLDNYEDAVPAKTVFEYTFDGEKPATRTETDLTNNTVTTVKYNNGRVYDYEMKHLNSGSTAKRMFQYGNGGEYFTMVLHDDFMSGEGYAPDVMMEEMDSVSVATENGLLKRTTNTGIYTKWSEGEEKKWVRFNGKYSADYDDEGIVSLLSAVYSVTGYEEQGKFEVKKENGRITEITRYTPSGGEWKPYEKYVFEYNDTEISPSRYATMINNFIADHGGNYYFYNWY